jgi:hypothetical protein
MATRNDLRRQRWFDAGKVSVERVIGRTAPGYLCPLCLRWCTTLDDVRLEDAPPKSVRGRPVALTCDECNHTAGHRLEGELHKAEDLRRWYRREPTRRPLEGWFAFNDIALRMESRWVDGALEVGGIPRANNPATRDAQIAALRASSTPDGQIVAGELKISHPTPDWRRAQIGWLKAGYVAAFALLGYRWALRSALDVVRAQIADPETERLQRFYLPRRSGDSSRRVILWIHTPTSLECLWVVMDNHAVVLPGLKASDRSARIYDRLNARKYWPLRSRTTNAMDWETLGWPTGPELKFDQLGLASGDLGG